MSATPIQDPLTGAYTRATFGENLRAIVEHARRENVSCSLLMFDLDHFKSINDAFGHAQGDKALIGVARLAQNITRDSDILFRYGGDEFVLLMPKTAKAEASELARRLLESIRAHPFGKDAALTLTISIGVAAFPEDATDEHTLFEKADARNYEAKRRGRARVVAEDTEAPVDLPFAELSRLIERDEVLEASQIFMAALIDQQRGVLSILGENGVGRSRTLTEVEKRARMQGFEVISLHGSSRLKGKPYGVLENIIHESSLDSSLHMDVEKFTELLQSRLDESNRGRLLISIDGLPHLDWGSLDLLRQLLSSSTIPVLGLVYTSDPDYARVAAPFQTVLSERVTLRPLTSAGLRVWLRILLQWELPDDFIRWLEQETRGLPQQVEQVLKHMLKHGAIVKQGLGWQLKENYAAIGAEGLRQLQRRLNPNNLPAALTSFIGRENELAEVRRLLAATRLLTVVGPGGMGKTRLTLQVAKEALNGFKDGIWLIELAPLTDSALTLYTIASILGMREEQNHPLLNTLTAWLSDKELLFVLDNCEHMLEAVAQFADTALRACPNVRILASSREAFEIAGELTYRMPALETPQSQSDFSIAQLMHYTSARLFIERAAFADSMFSVTESNVSSIARICHQLDGIPLAIELAAARLRSMSLEEITAGLDDRFRLLTSGNRMALPRQQTLRALIDWSYDMLSEPERMLLSRLSIFVGGWTLEAAEQVCVKGGGDFESSNILELLKRLVNKSLVSLDEQPATARYHVLETIKQYAHGKLLEANENEQLRGQHLNYYLKLAEQTEPIMISAQRGAWVRQLESEHHNLRAALEYACEHNSETARWLAGTLGWFWYFGDHLNEGRAWCVRVLELKDGATSGKELAKALGAAGMLSSNLGYNEESLLWLEKSFSLWQTLDEKRLQAESMFWLSYTLVQLGEDDRVCALYAENESILRNFAESVILGWSLSYWGRALENLHGDYTAAKVFHDESVALGNDVQDLNILGTAYMNLGHWSSQQGDYIAGYQYHLESLNWHRMDGARLRISISLHNMADMLYMQGKYEKAQPLYGESLALSRALGDQAFIAWTCYRLGYLCTYQGRYEHALEYFAESLKLYRGQTEQELITSCLAGCAELQRAQGHFERAAYLLGYVTAHPQSEQRIFLLAIDSIEYNRSLEALRMQCPESDFNTAWSEGLKMTMKQAIELALD